MNTRNRPERMRNQQPSASRLPYGLGTAGGVLQARPRQPVFAPQGIALNTVVEPNPACSTGSGRVCRHPLTNEAENIRLLEHEQTIKGSFDAIVKVLKRIASLQHEADFTERAQVIAREQLGFELPAKILDDAWIADLDMRALYGECVMQTLRQNAEQNRRGQVRRIACLRVESAAE